MKRKLLLLTFAMPVIMCQDAIAQTSSRLVAEAHWRNNGAAFNPIDSSYFNYSGSRGGDLTHTLKYDNYTTWTFAGDSAMNYWHYIQTFDSNNNILTTESQYWDSTGWIPSTNLLYSYNGLNQVTTMITQTWNGSMWVPITENVYSYDPAHVLYSNLLQTWNSFVLNWDPSSQETYYYDAYHNLVNQTNQTYVSSLPVYTNQYAYTYSATNQLMTTAVSTWNGAGWDYDSLYTNTYDTLTGNIVNTLGQTYNATTSVWMNQILHLYNNFVAGTHLAQDDIYQNWDSTGSGVWKNIMRYTYSYNSYGQMTSSTGMSWNVTGLFQYAVNDPLNKYYYADYNTGVKPVTPVAGTGDNVSVYPVPAQNVLHVDLTWNEAQAATISISDVQGRVVNQWNAPAGKDYRSAVSVNNLAPGNYFLKINGAKKQIVKQVVIAR